MLTTSPIFSNIGLVVFILLNLKRHKDVFMNKSLKKAIGVTGLMLSTLLCGINANATEVYADEDEWNPVNGFQIRGECNPNQSTEFDICDPEVAKKLKQMIKAKPNFGKKNSSVLTRFWDNSTDSWMYIAVEKNSMKLHPFFMGVRNDTRLYPELKDAKNVKVSFGEKDRICTVGEGVAFEGDIRIMSRTDQYKTADFCTFYDENNGFTGTGLHDSKTGELITHNGDIE